MNYEALHDLPKAGAHGWGTVYADTLLKDLCRLHKSDSSSGAGGGDAMQAEWIDFLILCAGLTALLWMMG